MSLYLSKKRGILVTLKVTDLAGLSTIDTVVIKVGNTLPQVAINASSNTSFFFKSKQVQL